MCLPNRLPNYQACSKYKITPEILRMYLACGRYGIIHMFNVVTNIWYRVYNENLAILNFECFTPFIYFFFQKSV